MGRPLADIDENKVAELAYLGALNSEIGAFFGVDGDTIKNRFSSLVAKQRSLRRFWLRGLQSRKAEQGDSTMLIWLGKNELHQTDKVEQQHSGGITINVVYEDVEPNAAAPEDPPQSSPSPLL